MLVYLGLFYELAYYRWKDIVVIILYQAKPLLNKFIALIIGGMLEKLL